MYLVNEDGVLEVKQESTRWEKKMVQTRSLGNPLCEGWAGEAQLCEGDRVGEQCFSSRAVSGDSFDVTAERWCYCHLVGRGQGCDQTSHNAQSSPHSKGSPDPKGH